MGLSGKYVQMLSGNIPVLRGLSLLYGLKQIPGPFIHKIAVSKGAGSVLNGFESMVGQINMNLKQPEYAEKFHLNFYLNQGGRSEYNTFYTLISLKNGPLPLWLIMKISPLKMIEIKMIS